ncbi:MAG: heme-binding protein [Acidobacteria bacterium]|nr:heme-binding protein [Acidobacteriota bacterium]
MRVRFVLLAAAMAAAAAPASAQLLAERNISLQAARALADASIACARKDGYDVTVAVVDRAGNLKVLMRGDLANPHNAELARKKAYTARTYGVTTMEFRNRTRGTDLEGQRDLTDIIPLGGGVPIIVGNERVGGLGLSGAPTQEADDKCAHEALKSVAAQLK